MNIKNALGFFILGLVMYSVSVLAEASGESASAESELAVRMVWLSFMGWVTSLIGLTYLLKEGVVRLPVLWVAVKADPWIRPLVVRAEETRVPEGVRAAVSN